MAQFVQFIAGTWLDDSLDEEAARNLQLLTHPVTDGVFDAVLSLAMYEQASARLHAGHGHDQWERDRERERAREQELAAEDPREFGAPDCFEWMDRLREQARRDIVREKWETGELPDHFRHRLPFLHAQMFVSSLAQVRRTLRVMADTAPQIAELASVCDNLDAAVPSLKAVRDSVEHVEDRIRGLDRNRQPLILAPVTNSAIHAPNGGALIGGMLNNNSFGWTVNHGTYQEVEVSDATVEAARVVVQRALDTLPWKPFGYPTYLPYG